MNKSITNSKLASSKVVASTEKPTYLDQVLQSDYIHYVWKVGLSILAFFVLFMLAKWIASLASKKFYESTNIKQLNKQESMGQLIYDIVFYVLLIIAVFIAFEIVGFDVEVILGGISFGVGFAFKEILGNMIAGVMMLNIKELKLGDIIQVDGNPGYFGKIEEITIRYTVIRTLELRQVIIPNMELISNPIKTYSSEELIKLNTIIPVSYDTDLDQAMKIMVDSVNALDLVHQKTSTKAYITQYGDAGVEIKVYFWVDPNCGLPEEYIKGDINQAIIAGLRNKGIKMPYKHIVATMDENDQDILDNLRALRGYGKKNNSSTPSV